MDRTVLESLLHQQIPLSRAMQVRVLKAEVLSGVEIRADLDPNHNHLGTAFGGSLSSLMILAAYSFLFQLIGGKGHVLIKSSSLQFLIPVREELRAICRPPSAPEREAFLDAFRRKGVGRLHLDSEIVLTDGRVAARLRGEFVGKP